MYSGFSSIFGILNIHKLWIRIPKKQKESPRHQLSLRRTSQKSVIGFIAAKSKIQYKIHFCRHWKITQRHRKTRWSRGEFLLLPQLIHLSGNNNNITILGWSPYLVSKLCLTFKTFMLYYTQMMRFVLSLFLYGIILCFVFFNISSINHQVQIRDG